jgi:hypothetical protein
MASLEQQSGEVGVQPPPIQSSLHLRVWPAFLLLILLAGTRLAGIASQEMSPKIFMLTFFGPLAAQALALLWWLLFSRARLADRFLVPLVVVGAGFASVKLSHHSVQSMVFAFYVQVAAAGAFLVAVLVLRRFERGESTARSLAKSDRSRLVLLHRRGGPDFHAGAARPERGGRLLRRRDRQGSLAS